jgi:predicted P-loop ATPase
VWYVVNEMLRRGYAPERVVATILDQRNGISAHVLEHPQGAAVYAQRQVQQAMEKLEFVCRRDKKGKATEEPLPSVDNVNVALLKLGVRVKYDQFADRVLLAGLDGYGPALEDAAVVHLWFTLARRYKIELSRELLFTMLMETARLNGFHPVRDYLDGLVWDTVPRLDTWLIHYAGAADTAYVRAVSALMLMAAVRRVRQPGCKYDEMVTFEDPVQGTNKSTALEVMAVRWEWFADDLPLHIGGKEAIELLRGKWIVEASELSGMRRTEIAHLKAMLSRRFDRGRLAYDRVTSEVPRQSIIVGTTNDAEYLKDGSGNRRFWPVRTHGFNVEALMADRDQLWAEAAAREAKGASIRLPEKLWPVAAKEQLRRLTKDPYSETLAHHLSGYVSGKITSEDAWLILDIKAGQRGQAQSRRMGDAMRALGWRRANSASTIKLDKRDVSGWVLGEQPWERVHVSRGTDGKLSIWGGTEGGTQSQNDLAG